MKLETDFYKLLATHYIKQLEFSGLRAIGSRFSILVGGQEHTIAGSGPGLAGRFARVGSLGFPEVTQQQSTLISQRFIPAGVTGKAIRHICRKNDALKTQHDNT
jgi:hypothetical protein